MCIPRSFPFLEEWVKEWDIDGAACRLPGMAYMERLRAAKLSTLHSLLSTQPLPWPIQLLNLTHH